MIDYIAYEVSIINAIFLAAYC